MRDRLIQDCDDGLINVYMRDKILNVLGDGLTEDIYEELLTDAQNASKARVDTDKKYNVYFNIIRLSKDMGHDTFGIDLDDQGVVDFCCYAVDYCDDGSYTFDNLVDYRILMHKWLCDRMNKKAYPNIEGKHFGEPKIDIDRWVSTLKDMYSIVRAKQANRQEAFEYVTVDWDKDEKRKFDNWIKYYEEGTTEKYNVKTAGFDFTQLPSSLVNRKDESVDLSTYKKPEPTEKEMELQRAKQYKMKMYSRLRSLRRLLERYSDVLPHHNLDSLRDEIHALEKSIGRLNVYAVMKDCTIRTANKIKALGFSEGSDILYKIAEEPISYTQTNSATYKMKEALNKLEYVGKALKTRDLIRELAAADILLNDIGIASMFSEIANSQSKLIEAFGYASTKIEDVISKLRGTGKPVSDRVEMPKMPAKEIKPPVPQMPSEKLDAGEIMTKPLGEVHKKLPNE